jgi:hypothetical protein
MSTGTSPRHRQIFESTWSPSGICSHCLVNEHDRSRPRYFDSRARIIIRRSRGRYRFLREV